MSVVNYEYHKRALTDNMLLKVVSNDASLLEGAPEKLLALTMKLANAEQAGQHDSCPIEVMDDLRDSAEAVIMEYPGQRMRHMQITGVLSVGDLSGLTKEAAETLVACGSVAIVATSFDQQSLNALLESGVLPLLSDGPIDPETYVYVKGVRNDVIVSSKNVQAFVVGEDLEPFALRLPYLYTGQHIPFNQAHLAALLQER